MLKLGYVYLLYTLIFVYSVYTTSYVMEIDLPIFESFPYFCEDASKSLPGTTSLISFCTIVS